MVSVDGHGGVSSSELPPPPAEPSDIAAQLQPEEEMGMPQAEAPEHEEVESEPETDAPAEEPQAVALTPSLQVGGPAAPLSRATTLPLLMTLFWPLSGLLGAPGDRSSRTSPISSSRFARAGWGEWTSPRCSLWASQRQKWPETHGSLSLAD